MTVQKKGFMKHYRGEQVAVNNKHGVNVGKKVHINMFSGIP